MGNRCVITDIDKNKTIYQHWNGGRDTIQPMLDVVKELGGNFDTLIEVSKIVFDGEVVSYERADTNNWDNGVYVIDDNLNIVAREYHRGELSEQEEHDHDEMVEFIKNKFMKHYLGLK